MDQANGTSEWMGFNVAEILVIELWFLSWRCGEVGEAESTGMCLQRSQRLATDGDLNPLIVYGCGVMYKRNVLKLSGAFVANTKHSCITHKIVNVQ